jgi:hypothetical protein
VDAEGNYYFCHLSRTKDLEFPEFIDRIVVQVSAEHGNKFNDGAEVGYNGKRVQDKHWITSDNTGSSYRGNVYLSWTEFDKYNSRDTSHHSRIRFSRSMDKGKTFSGAFTISDTVGDCLDSDHTLEGATPAVGPAGEVYVAWGGHNKISFDRSTDGGQTFGKDLVIAEQAGGWDIPVKRLYRSNGMPFISCDVSKGPHRGNIYVNYSDTRNGDVDVFCLRSEDGGRTWSAPLRVNNDALSNGKDQFMSHMAVDQADGSLYIVYYDRRHSENNVFMDVYMAYSTDGGKTFTNFRVTNSSFPPPGDLVFFGDYIGVAAMKGMIRPIWTDVVGDELEVKAALLKKKKLKKKPKGMKPYVGTRTITEENKLIIHLYLPKGKQHELKLSRITGEDPKILSSGEIIPGDHELVVRLENYSKGTYKLELTVDGKMVESIFTVSGN